MWSQPTLIGRPSLRVAAPPLAIRHAIRQSRSSSSRAPARTDFITDEAGNCRPRGNSARSAAPHDPPGLSILVSGKPSACSAYHYRVRIGHAIGLIRDPAAAAHRSVRRPQAHYNTYSLAQVTRRGPAWSVPRQEVTAPNMHWASSAFIDIHRQLKGPRHRCVSSDRKWTSGIPTSMASSRISSTPSDRREPARLRTAPPWRAPSRARRPVGKCRQRPPLCDPCLLRVARTTPETRRSTSSRRGLAGPARTSTYQYELWSGPPIPHSSGTVEARTLRARVYLGGRECRPEVAAALIRPIPT